MRYALVLMIAMASPAMADSATKQAQDAVLGLAGYVIEPIVQEYTPEIDPVVATVIGSVANQRIETTVNGVTVSATEDSVYVGFKIRF